MGQSSLYCAMISWCCTYICMQNLNKISIVFFLCYGVLYFVINVKANTFQYRYIKKSERKKR